jgi:hypothetical protein
VPGDIGESSMADLEKVAIVGVALLEDDVAVMLVCRGLGAALR